jgi:hypothetical protein
VTFLENQEEFLSNFSKIQHYENDSKVFRGEVISGEKREVLIGLAIVEKPARAS